MALIKIICPFCGTKLKVDESQLGTTGKCSACRKIFPIKPAEELPEATQQDIHDIPKPPPGLPSCGTNPPKKAIAKRVKGNPVLDFLFFRTMLFPFLIQILSLALSIALFLAGVFLIVSGQFLQGGILVISPIFLRLFFEGVMILFSIHKTLQEIRDHLEEHCQNRED